MTSGLVDNPLGTMTVVHGINATTTAPTLEDDILSKQQAAAACLLSRFVLHTLLAGTICIVGIIGNTLSMYILGKDSQSPVATFMLQWLAGADNLFLIFWGIHLSVTALIKHSGVDTHISWLFIRVYTYPVMFIAQSATIWMTVVIAASRYISVCLPYKAPQIVTMPNTKKAVLGTWVFSILYNVPRFFERYLKPVTKNGTTHYQYTVTLLGANSYYHFIYFDILYYITSFVLPLLLLAILNTRLTVAYQIIKKRRARLCASRAGSSSSDNDNNITLVMIIVVLTFMLTQAPARMVQILWEYKYTNCDTVQFVLIEISKILEVLNSSINIFIYYGLRAKFREALNSCLCPCGGCDALLSRCGTKRGTTRLPLSDTQNMTTEATCLSTPETDNLTTVSVLMENGDNKKSQTNDVAAAASPTS